MSFQHGFQCFGTQPEAWAALAASQVGGTYSAGSAVFVIEAAVPSATGIAYALRDLVSGATVAYSVAPTMEPCALLDWEDGLELGWIVAGIWIIVAAIVAVRRGARSGGEA